MQLQSVNCSVVPVRLGSVKGTIWTALRFWLRVIFSVVLPFVVLAYFNTHIVGQLWRRKRRRRMSTTLTGNSDFSAAAAENSLINYHSPNAAKSMPRRREEDARILQQQPVSTRNMVLKFLPPSNAIHQKRRDQQKGGTEGEDMRIHDETSNR